VLILGLWASGWAQILSHRRRFSCTLILIGAAYHGTERRVEGLSKMEDAARGFAELKLEWQWWAGRIGALGTACSIDERVADARLIAQGGLIVARQRGNEGLRARF